MDEPAGDVRGARVALVGGGSSGIGLAAGRALAEAGHRVVLVGRRPGPLADAARDLAGRTGASVLAVPGDLGDAAAAPALLAEVERSAGAPDVLVLNAGGPRPGRVRDLGDDDWRAAFELLLLGPLRLAVLAMRGMADRGFGRVVAVTSTAVRRPDPGLAASDVLRAAMTAAVGLLALEAADRGVTVNAVAPGATATPRRAEVLAARAAARGLDATAIEAADAAAVPAGRPARPREVGDAIAFLASEAASYVNGTVLTVDGGKTGVW